MEQYGKFTPTALNDTIVIDAIVTLHYFKYSKDFTFCGEKHNFWEMAYVDYGEVGVVAESQGFDLRQGEAIFHKPDEYHNIWAKNTFANVVVLTFLSQSPAMSFFENKIIPFNEPCRSLLAKIVKLGEEYFAEPLSNVHQTGIEWAKDPPFACGQALKNYIELLLILLVQGSTDFSRQSRLSSDVKREGEDYIVESIKLILSENLYNQITYEDILKKVCFSKSYFTKLFRHQTGCSIMAYHMNLRIEEAQRLISERNLSLTQISEKLGFSSIHYFSAIFKKKTNMTPSEYKKTVQSTSLL